MKIEDQAQNLKILVSKSAIFILNLMSVSHDDLVCEYGLVTITSVKRLAGAYTCPHFDLVVDNANQRILVVDHEVPKSVKMHVCTQLE